MKADVIKLLDEYCLTPNKALGQNFLSDDAAAGRIAALAGCAGKSVLEIGPGLGMLTEPLLLNAARMVAVEIDKRMVEVLGARLKSDKLTVLHADFLKADEEELTRLLKPPAVVAANLPYYVTTPICTRLFTLNIPIERMVLMVQSDAARRFFAKPSDRVYGPMTVLCDHLYTVEEAFTLGPGSYYPEPQVDSSVLVFTRRDTPYCPKLPALLNHAFLMRRKTLLNNLKPLGFDSALIERAGISPCARAETLTTDEFLRLAACIPNER